MIEQASGQMRTKWGQKAFIRQLENESYFFMQTPITREHILVENAEVTGGSILFHWKANGNLVSGSFIL